MTAAFAAGYLIVGAAVIIAAVCFALIVGAWKVER
jgi:hypothetical protein